MARDGRRASVLAGWATLDVYVPISKWNTKADRSPLTLADRRSHDVIVAHLEATGIRF